MPILFRDKGKSAKVSHPGMRRVTTTTLSNRRKGSQPSGFDTGVRVRGRRR